MKAGFLNFIGESKIKLKIIEHFTAQSIPYWIHSNVKRFSCKEKNV